MNTKQAKILIVDDEATNNKEHSGTQFDPGLTQIFLQNLKDILKIKDRYAEDGDMNFSQQYRDAL